MSDLEPFLVIGRVVELLDGLGIPYALGGSIAASLYGEPRSTADVDIAIAVDRRTGDNLLEAAAAEFYVPVDTARAAIDRGGSFNLIPLQASTKVDLFTLGSGLLDRRQIERRILVQIPGVTEPVWITSAEDVVLRKLDWYRMGGEVSDRQWRDILGVIRVIGERLDLADMEDAAAHVGLTDLLNRAVEQAQGRTPPVDG